MNCVIGVYCNNIIDGENTYNRILSETHLNLASGDDVKFPRVCKGFILIPWQKRLCLSHTPKSDYNFKSYKFMVVNKLGEGQYLTMHHKKHEKKGNSSL